MFDPLVELYVERHSSNISSPDATSALFTDLQSVGPRFEFVWIRHINQLLSRFLTVSNDLKIRCGGTLVA